MQQVEIERAWRLTKERMDKYMIEVEQWKATTIEIFQEQIHMKDKELSQLRELKVTTF